MPAEVRAWKDPVGMGRTVIKRALVILAILALLWVIVAAVSAERFAHQMSGVLSRLAH